eukprot:UN20087
MSLLKSNHHILPTLICNVLHQNTFQRSIKTSSCWKVIF